MAPGQTERSSFLRGKLWETVLRAVRGTKRVVKRIVSRAPRGEYALWGLFLGLSGIFLWSAFSGPQGVVELVKRRGSLRQLEEDNKVLLLRNQALEKEVYLLRNSRDFLEKVAREEYGYAYEGEKVYILSSGDPVAGSETFEEKIRENVRPPTASDPGTRPGVKIGP